MLDRLLAFFTDVGAEPDDSDDIRIQKGILVAVSSVVGALAVVWGGLYLFLGEPLAGAIPLTYSAASFTSLAVFSKTKRYGFYKGSQLVLMLLLPFVLQTVLGGFVNSSAVVIWALFAPLGAMFMDGRRRALGWLAAFLGLLVLSGVLTPALRQVNNLGTGTIVTFFVMNTAGVSALSFLLVAYFVSEREKAYALLDAEKDRSERLLLNVLPETIAERLKLDEGVIADHFGDVTVLFADIVGFTPLSSAMDPEEMVSLLNEVFTEFDGLVARFGLEKIRTIGDNYMVASGVPDPRTDHAQAAAEMALSMLDVVDRVVLPNGDRLQFRVGMNSGPVVAGIIGESKFQYDVWGDTVNTASRMESHGVPGRIQITESTYRHLEGRYAMEPRGTIDVKGKGEMETWFLVGRK